MSRRSTRLSAKALISNEVSSNSPSVNKSSRVTRRRNTIITEQNKEETAIAETEQIEAKASDKSKDSCYGSSNDDSSSTEESATTVKTTYYNSPGKRKYELKENDECNALTTPPKQRKLYHEDDDEENKILSPKTPSTLLSKLALTSPLSKTEERNCSSRKTLWPSGNIYQDAKRALHSTTPENLPGRQKEFEELEFFIKEHLEEKRSGSLYISGPPGTGKTACLTLILEKANSDFKKVYVNCTSIKSAGTIYSRIIKELGVKGSARNEKEYLALIEKHFSKSRKMNLLVLDEMDQLESKNQSVLYTIFEWPARLKDNVVLIGIANALDLTDRILPRLQARCELKPQLLHFAPYSKQQILQIITSRLEEADALKVFSPPALHMLAGKVAAVSGDVRRALDIARRVVDIIEKDSKVDVLQSIENMNADEVKTEEVKKVDLKEVVGVLNKVYGTTQNLSEDCDSDFPLQQKIVICSLLLMLQKWRSKDVTVGKLHDLYKKICTKRNLFSVDQGEFVSLCSLIETKGIIRVSGKKEPRLHKVTLEWDQAEVIDALKDKVLISSILQDDSFLNKF